MATAASPSDAAANVAGSNGLTPNSSPESRRVENQAIARPAPVPAPIGGTVAIGAAHVEAWRLVIMFVVIAAVAVTYLAFTRT